MIGVLFVEVGNESNRRTAPDRLEAAPSDGTLPIFKFFPSMKPPMLLFILAAAVMVVGPLQAANTPTVVQAATGISGKLARHSILSVAEVAALSRSGFPETQLRAHLRSSRAIYRLSTHDIAELKSAGVSNAVIGEMLARTYVPAPVRRYAHPGHRFYRAPFPSHGAGSFGSLGGRGRFHGGGPGHH